MWRSWPAAMVFLSLAGLPAVACAQDGPRWIVRLGGTASGTLDDGIINFAPGTGLGAQAFHFSNSWGASLTAERVWNAHWLTGVHLAWSPTTFRLTLSQSNGQSFVTEDRTTFAPALVEIKYGFLPDRRVNPFVGVTGGLLLARDVQLSRGPGEPLTDFSFADNKTFGYTLGADLSMPGGWLLHLSVRSLGFEYALDANALVPAQTLLDQSFADAFNHFVLGIGRRW